MREVKRYKKVQGTKNQQKKLNIINKFQDAIAEKFFDTQFKIPNKKNKN